MGNPNVGKSTIFSRITGVNATISNYPGTTVEVKKGRTKIHSTYVEVIDVPGTYSLSPTCKAEEVASDIIQPGDVIINILDATNLERNLYLTLQLIEKQVPIIAVLNFWDETKHRGIHIDIEKLENALGIPFVPTVAASGEGIKELINRLDDSKTHTYNLNEEQRWQKIGELIHDAQHIVSKRHTLLETLEDLSLRPVTGILFALLILGSLFSFVRFVSEGMITFLFDPLFRLYHPLVTMISNAIGPGFLHTVLIGTLIDDSINFSQSMGLLTTGLYVPFSMVLPYIFGFYLMLGIMEDSGYLPRLATLVDTLLHKLGMHGIAIVPMLLGMGCNVSGTLATRILNTRRQRFIASTLMCIGVPCAAQMAMIFGLLGKNGWEGIGTVFLTLFSVWLIIGLFLNRCMKGGTPETFIEIPPYRIPYIKGLIKKVWMRTRSFFFSIPYLLLGVLLVNIFYASGLLDAISTYTAPVISGLMGLPKEAVGAMITGFLRKDVAIGMLLPLQLSTKQLIISCIALTMYFPCVATFIILFKEFGLKDMLKALAIMLISTLIVGTTLNIIL